MSETEFIRCRGQLHALLPWIYWHLTHPNGMMLHNAWLAEGICPQHHSSTGCRAIPGGAGGWLGLFPRLAGQAVRSDAKCVAAGL